MLEFVHGDSFFLFRSHRRGGRMVVGCVRWRVVAGGGLTGKTMERGEFNQ